MAIFATYSDLNDFLNNSNHNIEVNSLYGGNTTLSGSAAAGATSLPLTSTTGFPSSGTFQAYVLEGIGSEVVSGSISGSNLLVPAGTQVAHTTNANVVSAGSAGNLAKTLVDACRMADMRCRQGAAGAVGLTASAATALASPGVSAGATSATVVASTLATGRVLFINGLSSEVVQATVSGTTLTFATGLQYAHSAGVTVVMAGTGDRTLYLLPRTETYRLTTMQAHIDPDQTLLLNPYHFPVQSVVSGALTLGTYTPGNISLTSVQLPDAGRSIQIPYVTWAGSPSILGIIPQPALRDPNVWLTLTYLAGPIPLATGSTPQPLVVPDDIKRAVFLYTLFLLATRSNTLGAASQRQGDVQRQFELRGMAGKHSLLQQDADDILTPYRR